MKALNFIIKGIIIVLTGVAFAAIYNTLIGETGRVFFTCLVVAVLYNSLDITITKRNR